MPTREGALRLMEWSTTHSVAARMGYNEDRPDDIAPSQRQLISMMTAKPGEVVIEFDCWMYLKWIALHAGWRSPDGNRYGEDRGDTQIGWEYLVDHFTDTSHVHVGTIGIYGGGGPIERQHAVMAMNDGGSLVASMGSADGPLRVPKVYEDGAHRGVSFTWCSVARLLT